MTALVLVFAKSADHKSAVDYVPWAAVIALAGALLVAAWNQYEARRDRRRDLYSEAYKAVVSWGEMSYRVRRRDPDKPYELVEQFHRLQESIDYHEGWIGIESPVLARAYAEFVRAVKSVCGPVIKSAWADEPCDPRAGFAPPDGSEPVDIADSKSQFLADVNDHLSLKPHRRRALRKRYPDPTGASNEA